MEETLHKEGLRQQMLLRALWRDARPGVVAGWLRDAPERSARGLQVYRANAGALAERALAAAYPTLVQLLGEASFAALARALWSTQPPARGDMAQWGAELPAFIAAAEQLAAEPYLADVARLEWAVHQAHGAADSAAEPDLTLLAEHDPAALRLLLRPGTALVLSSHPIATIWQAHRKHDAERFSPVRAAFANGLGEAALVWRQGFMVDVSVLVKADAQFVQAVLQGQSVAQTLEAAGDQFSFETWLIDALQQGWLVGAVSVTPHTHSKE